MDFFDQYLKVKTSTLKGCGKGLFTKIAIPKDSIITEYKGKISTWNNADHDEGRNAYIFQVSMSHAIDAKNQADSFAHFANDAEGFKRIDGVKNNSMYIIKRKRVFVVAIKDILPNDEIFVGYGKEYWKTTKKNKIM